MPRFLNTSTGEFEWHNHPEKVIYAILSHVWRDTTHGGEQSYQDVLKLQDAMVKSLRRQKTAGLNELKGLESLRPSLIRRIPNPLALLENRCTSSYNVLSHPSLSDKIKGVCTVAREAGFRLVWSDACCIDKSSSAELSEAINSMYEWYRLAHVCYVYLEDVPDGDIPSDHTSRFRVSRWHKRGWTLQELIAPERIEFLTRTWRFLGTKIGLASTLEEITGVDFDILTGRATVDSANVARRMSWAAERETARIEDQAYSLMGVFGVHMSPIYGEGDNAFLRLQEEIIRTIPDHSIFAWAYGPDGLLRPLDGLFCDQHDCSYSERGLLARGPKSFVGSHNLTLLSPSDLASRLGLQGTEDVPPLHSVFSPQGVRVRLLCLDVTKMPQLSAQLWEPPHLALCAECKRLGQADTLAFLQCADRVGLIALPLCRTRESGNARRGRFITTNVASCGKRFHFPYRCVVLTHDALAEALQCVSPAPIEVFLLRHDSKLPSRPRGTFSHFGVCLWSEWYHNNALASFHIAPRSIKVLATLGVTPSPLHIQRAEEEITLTTTIQVACASNAEYARQEGGLVQTVRVQLVLTRINATMKDTMARFTIANTIHAPARDPPAPSSRHASPLRHTLVDENASPLLHSEDSSVSEVHSRRNPTDTIASADFLVPLSLGWHGEACEMRLLRVALELPVEGDALRHHKDLWLSIELSEPHRHTRANDLSIHDMNNDEAPRTSNDCSQAHAEPDAFAATPLLQSEPAMASIRSEGSVPAMPLATAAPHVSTQAAPLEADCPSKVVYMQPPTGSVGAVPIGYGATTHDAHALSGLEAHQTFELPSFNPGIITWELEAYGSSAFCGTSPEMAMELDSADDTWRHDVPAATHSKRREQAKTSIRPPLRPRANAVKSSAVDDVALQPEAPSPLRASKVDDGDTTERAHSPSPVQPDDNVLASTMLNG
ncbi:Vegetative incompatibility protein HET-E-1 [Trametes pubescens]|uniref:Vegetative incompatibility protein HET-E-1 n=1 Tax=Trametes pubescens TaxID=154538 RepID=A0A1M2VXA6_TRAPU|nr:Vegetative incompatibility protein HET-E-1 [Trametes pubescens]